MKLSRKQYQQYLDAIAALPDEAIDTSDIPELTEEDFRRGVRGMFYRPIKKPVTMRLDADVLQWLKKDGPGYQTKANWILRYAMLRSLKRDASSQKAQPRRRAAATKSKQLKKAG